MPLEAFSGYVFFSIFIYSLCVCVCKAEFGKYGHGIENMKDQRLDVERNLRIGVQSYLNDMQQAMDDLAANRETLKQAQKAYDIAKKQYEVGMNTWLDLNNAELTLTNTQLTYCQSLYNYITAKANLDATLGIGQ